jgi:hypothetical protein
MKLLSVLTLATLALALPSPKPLDAALEAKRDAGANAGPTPDDAWTPGPRGESWFKRDADAAPTPDDAWTPGPRGESWFKRDASKREADADAGPTPDDAWTPGPRGESWFKRDRV